MSISEDTLGYGIMLMVFATSVTLLENGQKQANILAKMNETLFPRLFESFKHIMDGFYYGLLDEPFTYLVVLFLIGGMLGRFLFSMYFYIGMGVSLAYILYPHSYNILKLPYAEYWLSGMIFLPLIMWYFSFTLSTIFSWLRWFAYVILIHAAIKNNTK